MTLLVFCLLAVLWGAVFIPAIVRARLDSSPIATVGMFRRGMSALGASERTFADGRWILVPPKPEQILELRKRSLARHRQFLSWLILGAVVTLAVGILPGLHVLLKAHLLIDLAVVAHMLFLVKTRRKRLEISRESAPARRSAAGPLLPPSDRMVMPTERRRPSRPDRIIDIRTDTVTDPRIDTREALHVFVEDEEDDRWLKAGQF